MTTIRVCIRKLGRFLPKVRPTGLRNFRKKQLSVLRFRSAIKLQETAGRPTSSTSFSTRKREKVYAENSFKKRAPEQKTRVTFRLKPRENFPSETRGENVGVLNKKKPRAQFKIIFYYSS